MYMVWQDSKYTSVYSDVNLKKFSIQFSYFTSRTKPQWNHCWIKLLSARAADKYSSASHHEWKNKKATSQTN